MVQEKKKLECENNECKRNFFSDSHVINNFESEPIFTDISQNEEDNERFTLITNAQKAEHIKNTLKPYIIEQLQEYSRTGNRLYDIDQIRREAHLGSKNTVTKYSKQILKQIFRSKALIIYQLILGQITTSYHNIKIHCQKLGFLLKTSPTEWFQLLLTKGSKRVRELRIRFECIKHGHITYKLITNILYNPEDVMIA